MTNTELFLTWDHLIDETEKIPDAHEGVRELILEILETVSFYETVDSTRDVRRLILQMVDSLIRMYKGVD